jgi:hypothetical protein
MLRSRSVYIGKYASSLPRESGEKYQPISFDEKHMTTLKRKKAM